MADSTISPTRLSWTVHSPAPAATTAMATSTRTGLRPGRKWIAPRSPFREHRESVCWLKLRSTGGPIDVENWTGNSFDDGRSRDRGTGERYRHLCEEASDQGE